MLIQLLESHGLHKYIDARCLQSELTEATGMTTEELDAAACCLLAEQQLQPEIDSDDDDEVEKDVQQRRLHSDSSDEALVPAAACGETPT